MCLYAIAIIPIIKLQINLPKFKQLLQQMEKIISSQEGEEYSQTYRFLKEQTLDVQYSSAKVLVKKETHAVVYTIKYLVSVHDLTLRVYKHPRFFLAIR